MRLGIITAFILLFIGIAICIIFILIPKKAKTGEKKAKKVMLDDRNKDSGELYKLSDVINATLLDKYSKDLANDTIEEASERISKNLFASNICGTRSSTSNNYSHCTGYLNETYRSDVWTLPRWDRDPNFIRRNMHSWSNYIQFYLNSKDDFDVLDDVKMGDIAYLKHDDEFYIYLGKDAGWEYYTPDNYLKLWEYIENK